jgi:hypothetical protein
MLSLYGGEGNGDHFYEYHRQKNDSGGIASFVLQLLEVLELNQQFLAN